MPGLLVAAYARCGWSMTMDTPTIFCGRFGKYIIGKYPPRSAMYLIRVKGIIPFRFARSAPLLYICSEIDTESEVPNFIVCHVECVHYLGDTSATLRTWREFHLSINGIERKCDGTAQLA